MEIKLTGDLPVLASLVGGAMQVSMGESTRNLVFADMNLFNGYGPEE